MGKYDYELEEWYEDDDFYTPEELALVQSALSGNGQTNGDRWNDSMGVMIPEEFELYIWGMADAFNIKRGYSNADIFGSADTDLYMENRTCRMEQSDIDTVTNWMADNGVYPKLLAYLNGDSWEKSGMSDYNDKILQGWSTNDSYTAEMMFIYYYMRNQGGDDGYEGVMYEKYGSLEGIMYDSNLPWDADGANEVLRKRWELIQDAKRQMLDQLTPVTDSLGIHYGDDYNGTDSINPGNSGDSFYHKQLETYNSNYEDAIKKIEQISTKITKVYNSFNGATGNDITKIRDDLTKLLESLEEISTKVKNINKKTNENADSCYRCYQSWNTKYGKAYIDPDTGMIYRLSKDDESDTESSDGTKKDKKVYATINTMLNN